MVTTDFSAMLNKLPVVPWQNMARLKKRSAILHLLESLRDEFIFLVAAPLQGKWGIHHHLGYWRVLTCPPKTSPVKT